MKNHVRLIAPFLCMAVLMPLSAELSSGSRKVIASAFTLDDRAKIIASLESGAARLSAPADKKAVLATLAAYEERTGSPDGAARHYGEAALADPASRDDSLLLDAARAALAANDAEKAEGFVRTVLLTCFDDHLLVRARVYAAWIALASRNSADDLSLVRSLAQGKAFEEYASELLFTLWWIDNDTASRDRLLASYPASPEAAIARGEMSLAPVPFWYLMGRNAALVSEFARTGAKNLAALEPVKTAGSQAVSTTAPLSVSNHTGDWQQVGFFKYREYADELSGKLTKLGFNPVIRTDKRPSGTVYFAVLVPEDAERTTGSRLKNEGFESYLVSDSE